MPFNIFNSQGALEEGEEYRGALNIGANEKMQQLNTMLPFTPMDEKERVYMERTMIPAGQNEQGVPQFMTPERMIANQNEAKLQALQAKEDSDFQKKVSNPLFKTGDFLADLARNTIGAPINFLTDGVGFQLDPSKSAVQGYKSRLNELDSLRTLNQQLFYSGRDKRAEAFSTAVTNRLGNKVSGAPRLNDKGEWVQSYEDGTAKVITDANGQPVSALDKSKVYMVAGVPHKYDPVTQGMTPVVNADEAFDLMQQQAYSTQFAKNQETYFGDRPSMSMAIRATKQRAEGSITTAVNGARKFIQDRAASGWNGLLSALPDSDQRVLKNYLQTISANVSFSELQSMRASNKNGAALGNVTERELDLLSAVLGSLDNLSSADQLLESLDTIETNSKQMITNLEMKMSELDGYYEYKAPAQATDPNAQQSPVDPDVAEMDKLMGF